MPDTTTEARTLDPHVAGFLNMLAEAGAPSSFEIPPEAARAGMRESITGNWDPEAFHPVASIEDAVVGAAGTPVQIIRPHDVSADGETVVFFHPGGFTLGEAELFVDVAQRISATLGAVVVNVDYRLAPENPYPAAVQDAVGVLEWVFENVATLGGNPGSIAVSGESSGANLASLASLTLRKRGLRVAAQLLTSPYTDFTREYPSMTENEDGYFLSRNDIGEIRNRYFGQAPAPILEDASPALGDLSGAPRSVIGVAGFDPLRDDGIVYAGRLLQAGVPTQLRIYPTLIHPFFGMPGLSPAADQAGDELLALFAEAIRQSATDA